MVNLSPPEPIKVEGLIKLRELMEEKLDDCLNCTLVIDSEIIDEPDLKTVSLKSFGSLNFYLQSHFLLILQVFATVSCPQIGLIKHSMTIIFNDNYKIVSVMEGVDLLTPLHQAFKRAYDTWKTGDLRAL